MSTPAATTPAATTATPLDKQKELLKLTLPQLKEKARALGTPVTGTKAKLVQMITRLAPEEAPLRDRQEAGTEEEGAEEDTWPLWHADWPLLRKPRGLWV